MTTEAERACALGIPHRASSSGHTAAVSSSQQGGSRWDGTQSAAGKGDGATELVRIPA